MKKRVFFLIIMFLPYLMVKAQSDVGTFAEEPPVFSRGDFLSFMMKQIEYPSDAKERKIQGKVFVSFVVDTAGKLSEIKLVKGLGYGCDEEALNAVAATSGYWIPAKNKGKKVSL